MKKFFYIYEIENLINHKSYIGFHSTDNLNDGYFGSGKYFCRSVRKYGKENFDKRILEFCSDENWKERENYWIIRKNTFSPNGYNLTKGGEGTLGFIVSQEIRDKISKTIRDSGILKGIKKSEDSKNKMSLAKKGKPSGYKGISHKEKLILAHGKNEGEKRYRIFIEKQKNSHIGKKLIGDVWNKGIPCTNECKEKLSKSLKDKKHNMKIMICPHCGKIGKGGNMTRYHFNNCKFNNILTINN